MSWLDERNAKFPKQLQLWAQAAERATGTPACVILAQWAHESAYGRYLSGKNNPFGIKGKPGTLCKTWEVYNGKTVHIDAYFKDFPTYQGAFEYLGRMLANPVGYYAKARRFYHNQPSGSADWEAYTRAIAGTYATDPAYAEKVVSYINDYHLHDFNLKRNIK